MTTKEIVVAAFMVVGLILCLVAGVNWGEGHHGDFIFFPLGVGIYMIGRTLDRFWKVA